MKLIHANKYLIVVLFIVILSLYGCFLLPTTSTAESEITIVVNDADKISDQDGTFIDMVKGIASSLNRGLSVVSINDITIGAYDISKTKLLICTTMEPMPSDEYSKLSDIITKIMKDSKTSLIVGNACSKIIEDLGLAKISSEKYKLDKDWSWVISESVTKDQFTENITTYQEELSTLSDYSGEALFSRIKKGYSGVLYDIDGITSTYNPVYFFKIKTETTKSEERYLPPIVFLDYLYKYNSGLVVYIGNFWQDSYGVVGEAGKKFIENTIKTLLSFDSSKVNKKYKTLSVETWVNELEEEKEVWIKWDGEDSERYEIWRKSAGGSQLVEVVTEKSTKTEDIIQKEDIYSYMVRGMKSILINEKSTFLDPLANNPPEVFEPNPADSSDDNPLNFELSWQTKDEDGDGFAYKVYFSEIRSKVENMEEEARVDINENNKVTLKYLKPYTTYYWRVVAEDERGAVTVGPVWNFKTGTARVVKVITTKIYGSDYLYSVTLDDDGYIVSAGENDDRDIILIKASINDDIIWEKAFGGSGDDRVGNVISTDDGYLIVGCTESTDVDFANPDRYPDSYGMDDIFLMKVNKNGEKLWVKKYGGSGHDCGNDYGAYMIETSDGNLLIVGYTDSKDGDFANLDSYGRRDIFLMKVNKSGDELWVKKYGGSENDYANCVYETSGGNFIIAGSSNNDAYVFQTDENGNYYIGHSVTLSGKDSDWAACAVEANDGNILVVGGTDSTDGYFSANHGEGDGFVAKINRGGTYWDVDWVKLYGGAGYDELVKIKKSINGEYYLAGYLGIERYIDGWILRIYEDSNIKWDSHFGGDAKDYADDIVELPNGGYVVVGVTTSVGGIFGEINGESDGFIAIVK